MEHSPVVASTAAPRRRRLRALLAGTFAVVLVLDQLSKYLVVEHLRENDPVTLVTGVLELRLTRNPGAAFSLSTGTTWVFTVIATAVSVVILRIARRLGSRGWAVALGLLLGGAVGNLVDRLTREPGFGRGHVVDFIHYLKFPFIDFPIFNLADSSIVCAAGLIMLLGLRNIGIDGSTGGSDAAAGSIDPARGDA